ncbi:MAG TPA: sulfotransferase [Actinomycetota bacterium]
MARTAASRDADRRSTSAEIVRAAVDRPVFLGGCPRSGTTMLRTMLHSHPGLAIPRETGFVLGAVEAFERWGDLREEPNRRRLVDWMIGTPELHFRRLKLDREAAGGALMAAPPTLGSILGTAFALYAERHGAARWGDKRPGYVLELDAVFALFPDVQFVSIVRDPRAVVASMRTLGWLEAWYDGTVAGGVDRWLRSVRSSRAALERYRADQFFELRYEDLVEEPEANLLALCRFAGLDENGVGAMLDFQQRAREFPKRKRARFHPKLDQPVANVSKDAWRSILTPAEVALIEHVAAPEMARFGYEPVSEDAPSATLRLKWARLQFRRWRRRRPRTASLPPGVAARITSAQRALPG